MENHSSCDCLRPTLYVTLLLICHNNLEQSHSFFGLFLALVSMGTHLQTKQYSNIKRRMGKRKYNKRKCERVTGGRVKPRENACPRNQLQDILEARADS